jgi:cyclohexyl-isocyanide hydratase
VAHPELDLPQFSKTTAPVRDVRGLYLTADAVLADALQIHLLHVPGGYGQEAFMENQEFLGWIHDQAAGAVVG